MRLEIILATAPVQLDMLEETARKVCYARLFSIFVSSVLYSLGSEVRNIHTTCIQQTFSVRESQEVSF